MDMRLLTVFDEVYKTRSVSRAAENLEIPQTTVSLSLARMRRTFNDPLFVRTSQGMVPTPHAAELLVPLRQALELLRAATRERVIFDPITSTRHFCISMTDVSHLEFLPKLVHRISLVAPSIHVEVLRISQDTRKLLESGESDLAIGYMPELEAGFYQQKIFEQGFACVVRKNHPRVERQMTIAKFRRERHVAITAPGTGHELLELELGRKAIERQVALSLPTLPGLGNLLAQTDLIATVPERVAQMLMSIAPVKALKPPFELPSFAIKQHWHERYQHDYANRWLRSLIADLFMEGTVDVDHGTRR